MTNRKSLIDSGRGPTVRTSPVRDDAVTMRRPTPERFVRKHGGCPGAPRRARGAVGSWASRSTWWPQEGTSTLPCGTWPWQWAGQERHRNAEDIVHFLSNANPNWPRATLAAMMSTRLSTTTDEVVARLTENWEQDVCAFDSVYHDILDMADALSDGIVAQCPTKF